MWREALKIFLKKSGVLGILDAADCSNIDLSYMLFREILYTRSDRLESPAFKKRVSIYFYFSNYGKSRFQCLGRTNDDIKKVEAQI